MFPNIDNNLGITAVRKALDSRSSKFPSTDCIAQAVEICLRVSNCHLSEQNFGKKYGELAVHFNSSQHDISQMIFVIIEQIISFKPPLHLDQLLLTREAYWIYTIIHT